RVENTAMAWSLERAVTFELAKRAPEVSGIWQGQIKMHLLQKWIVRTPPLRRLQSPKMRGLLLRFEFGYAPAKQELLAFGKQATHGFVLVSGQAQVMQVGMDGIPRATEQIEPGQSFGFFSVLRKRPCSSAVIMAEGGLVVKLSAQDVGRAHQEFSEFRDLVEEWMKHSPER
ncbi:MAG: cyclic nucleotide-binding domain-containing protein, partial [Myxococcota bacterium]